MKRLMKMLTIKRNDDKTTLNFLNHHNTVGRFPVKLFKRLKIFLIKTENEKCSRNFCIFGPN